MTRDFTALLRDERLNALLAWAIVAVLVGTAATSLLRGNLLTLLFATGVIALAVLPPVVLLNSDAMLPWEVLLLASLPVVGRLAATLPVTGNLANYLSVAAVALIIAVELHVFTPVEMTARFAVIFVAVATMAAAGGWAVIRWSADVLLGTRLLLDPALSETVIEEALMWEFVASTIAGLGAGLLFAVYVKRQIGTTRVPREVRPD